MVLTEDADMTTEQNESMLITLCIYATNILPWCSFPVHAAFPQLSSSTLPLIAIPYMGYLHEPLELNRASKAGSLPGRVLESLALGT